MASSPNQLTLGLDALLEWQAPPGATPDPSRYANITDDRALGFTGTQRGMTYEQQASVRHLLHLFEWSSLHHGDCIGADAQAHDLAVTKGIGTVIHPPDKDAKRAYKFSKDTRKPKPYLGRNRDIVDECWFLVAAPGEDIEVVRSGTWSTVRYARSLKRCVWVILPSGEITLDGVRYAG